MSEPYRGWTNWPTWFVYSWITSQEELYVLCGELAREGLDSLREEVENAALSHTEDIAHDLVCYALADVNWKELRAALMRGNDEQEQKEITT